MATIIAAAISLLVAVDEALGPARAYAQRRPSKRPLPLLPLGSKRPLTRGSCCGGWGCCWCVVDCYALKVNEAALFCSNTKYYTSFSLVGG